MYGRIGLISVSVSAMMALGACESNPPDSEKAYPSETCQTLDELARQPAERAAAKTVLIVDRTASRGAEARELPPGVQDVLTESQRRGDVLVTLAVNGDGAEPRRLPNRTLNVESGNDSTNARRAREAVVSCVDRWSLVDDALPTAPGTDLSLALTEAAHQSPSTVVVVSDGWTTSGALNVEAVGPDADPAQTATDLSALLPRFPDAADVEVTWFGLGKTSPALREDLRNSLKDLWAAALKRSGVSQVVFDDATSDGSADVEGEESTQEDTVTLPTPVLETTGGSIPSLLLFSPDEATVLPTAKPILEQIAQRLAANPSSEAVVTGHTAQYGTRAYRIDLSRKRAKAVVDALVELGVDRSRLNSRGVGSDEPAQPEIVNGRHDPEAASANRRVTIAFSS